MVQGSSQTPLQPSYTTQDYSQQTQQGGTPTTTQGQYTTQYNAPTQQQGFSQQGGGQPTTQP